MKQSKSEDLGKSVLSTYAQKLNQYLENDYQNPEMINPNASSITITIASPQMKSAILIDDLVKMNIII